MNKDRDYERFLEDLEGLKGSSPLYLLRDGLTDKVMRAIELSKKNRCRWREILGICAITGAFLIAWLL